MVHGSSFLSWLIPARIARFLPRQLSRNSAFHRSPLYDGISGLGGMAESAVIETQIRLSRENSSKVVFRGQYAAVTEVQSLDMCVLGRDITGLFAVIVDQAGGVVCMLSQRHHYTIQVA